MTSSYPQTGSLLSLGDAFGTNTTNTAISTNILLAVRIQGNGSQGQGGYQPIGAVQSMAISEKRAIKMIDEVGTDGHIDSVPNQSTNITGTCQRVRFQKLRIAEAFDRSFLHVAAQIYPFDIIIFDRQKFATGNQVTTVIKNVWISGIDYTYQVSDWVITDSMTWEAEYIYSNLGGTSALTGLSAAVGGQDNLLKPFGGATWIERQTDTGAGGRRGSLDTAGLIDLGSSNFPGSTGVF
jgi:hypothetical protein